MADLTPRPALIRLAGLRLMLSIGWGDEERRTPQPIRFDLDVTLPAPPAATTTDALDDTLDYAALAETIRSTATSARVRLLERLAGLVGAALAARIPRGAHFRLAVTKERAPIADLEGGATVELVLDGAAAR